MRVRTCAILFATACLSTTGPEPAPERYVRFIESLIVPSGLVQSRPNDNFTTAWKNALSAMVLLHEGNVAGARGILDVFQDYRQTQAGSFRGVPQGWDAAAAVPVPYDSQQPAEDYYWVGDGGGLLRAVQYYRVVTGDAQRYAVLETALKDWLAARADQCATIVAEGNANVYAALSAYVPDSAIARKLAQLRQCFYDDVQFDNIADHTVRAALVFGDPTGFAHVAGLARTETWCIDGATTVRGFAAFSGETYINADISAELLLAWRFWEQQSGMNLAYLEREMLRLQLPGEDPNTRGFPYLVTPHQFTSACSTPIVDTTVFMLFALWRWNPFTISTEAAVR